MGLAGQFFSGTCANTDAPFNAVAAASVPAPSWAAACLGTIRAASERPWSCARSGQPPPPLQRLCRPSSPPAAHRRRPGAASRSCTHRRPLPLPPPPDHAGKTFLDAIDVGPLPWLSAVTDFAAGTLGVSSVVPETCNVGSDTTGWLKQVFLYQETQDRPAVDFTDCITVDGQTTTFSVRGHVHVACPVGGLVGG